jgi:two-component system, NtrC family, nitrogen regulation response regulator NtrX
MPKARLLLVDDDAHIRMSLASYLRDSGFDIITAGSVSEATKLNNANIDLALLDLALPDGTGIDILQDIRQRFPNQTVVMISGEATLSVAVQAIKLGAVDFLEKPVSPEKVEITITNALRLTSLSRKLRYEEQNLLNRYALIGNSAKIAEVRTLVDAVCCTDSAVLLLGESGTGKEVAANLIHLKSDRRDKPFVAVNAAAVPRELLESEMFGHEKGAFTGATQRRIGRFEQASGGTLFLDEIAEMPPALQAKLLRVLEERKIERVGGDHAIDVDFRLICATNRNLQDEIKQGRFRHDLYFRINVFTITLPALREVSDDIGTIARHHLERLCVKMGRPQVTLGKDLIAALAKYHFPGNVRELRNIIEHLLITHRDGELTAADLSHLLQRADSLKHDLPLKDAVAQFESDYITAVLKRYQGNVSKASEVLGLDRSYLYRKMRSLGFEGEE